MRVVVAIDFGTARSGYAFAFTDDREVHMKQDWPDQPLAYVKTLTQLLFGPEGDLVAWGYTAPRALAKKRKDPRRHGYRLVRNFKMQLHNRNPHGDDPVIANGRAYNGLDLVTAYLGQLKEMVLSDLQGGGTGLLDPADILWCLTVPAIWTDAEKQLMRTAAQRAGLIGSSDAEAHRLRLVLEPEAAALYCQEKDTDIGQSQLRPGTRFMVVDAGGGTVDLTVHEVSTAGLKEVVAGSGGACGSTYLDQEFLRHVQQLLGPDVFRRFQEQEPIAFQQMLEDWERAKCDFEGAADEEVLIPISRELGRILDEPANRPVLRRLAGQQEGDEDYIHLKPGTMLALFQPVVEDIRKAVEQQFHRLNGERCDYLFLVGGFAGSPLLRQRIHQAFQSRVQKVVVPPDPGKAVLHGAVVFGLDEWRIRSRRTRLTYGCGIQEQFAPGVDPEAKKVWNSANARHDCADRFSVFVTADELIDIDQKVTRVYYPVIQNQTQMRLVFFATSRKTVRYTDESGVERLGELTVDMPNLSGGNNRTVEVAMYFGRTEIQVEARDQTSGTQARTSLHFSHSYSPHP